MPRLSAASIACHLRHSLFHRSRRERRSHGSGWLADDLHAADVSGLFLRALNGTESAIRGMKQDTRTPLKFHCNVHHLSDTISVKGLSVGVLMRSNNRIPHLGHGRSAARYELHIFQL